MPRRPLALVAALIALLEAAPAFGGESEPGWFDARFAAIQREIRLLNGAPLSGRASQMACGYVVPANAQPSGDSSRPADAGSDDAFNRALLQLRLFLRQRAEPTP